MIKKIWRVIKDVNYVMYILALCGTVYVVVENFWSGNTVAGFYSLWAVGAIYLIHYYSNLNKKHSKELNDCCRELDDCYELIEALANRVNISSLKHKEFNAVLNLLRKQKIQFSDKPVKGEEGYEEPEEITEIFEASKRRRKYAMHKTEEV